MGRTLIRGTQVFDGTLKAVDIDSTEIQVVSEKGANNGYAGLGTGGKVPTAQLGGSGADATKFLRGDQSWVAAAPIAAPVFVGATGDDQITANSPSGLTGQLLNLKNNGVSQLRVDKNGMIVNKVSGVTGGIKLADSGTSHANHIYGNNLFDSAWWTTLTKGIIIGTGANKVSIDPVTGFYIAGAAASVGFEVLVGGEAYARLQLWTDAQIRFGAGGAVTPLDCYIKRTAALTLETNTTFKTTVDFEASTANKGVIVKSPDGLTRKRIGIDNSGNLLLTTV